MFHLALYHAALIHIMSLDPHLFDLIHPMSVLTVCGKAQQKVGLIKDL